MNISETKLILMRIVTMYPSFLQSRDVNTLAEIWQRLFAEEPFKQVEAALVAFILADKKGFPPTVGQLKEKLSLASTEKELTEISAWGMVEKALHNGIYGYEQEFARLPKVVQGVIGDAKQLHEWAMMDPETVNSVVASNFQRAYRARAPHVQELESLPPSVRGVLQEIADAKRLESGAFALIGERQERDGRKLTDFDGYSSHAGEWQQEVEKMKAKLEELTGQKFTKAPTWEEATGRLPPDERKRQEKLAALREMGLE